MKKLFLLLATVTLMLAFTSCSGGGDDPHQNTDLNVLWSVGDTVNIVSETGLAFDVANELYNAVASVTGTPPKMLPIGSEAGECELLIGNTGRELSDKAYEKLDRMELGGEYDCRWLILCEGKSIAIAYDFDDEIVALNYAKAYFKENCIKASTKATIFLFRHNRLLYINDNGINLFWKWERLKKSFLNVLIRFLSGG